MANKCHFTAACPESWRCGVAFSVVNFQWDLVNFKILLLSPVIFLKQAILSLVVGGEKKIF